MERATHLTSRTPDVAAINAVTSWIPVKTRCVFVRILVRLHPLAEFEASSEGTDGDGVEYLSLFWWTGVVGGGGGSEVGREIGFGRRWFSENYGEDEEETREVG